MLAFLTRGFHKLTDPASVQVEKFERSNNLQRRALVKPVIAEAISDPVHRREVRALKPKAYPTLEPHSLSGNVA